MNVPIAQGLAAMTASLPMMSRLLHQFMLICFLVMVPLLVTNTWGQGVVQEALPERVPVDLQAQGQQALVPISLNLAGAYQEGFNVRDLGPVSAGQIVAADKAAAEQHADVHPGPLRVGVVRSVGAVPLSIEAGSALQSPLPEGGNIWTVAIRSPGAFGIRIHFSNFDVEAGSAVIYARGENGVIVRSPYTGKGTQGSGDFWSASLPGDIVFIEVSGTDEPRLEVAEILHFDKHLPGSVPGKEGMAAPLSCHLDVMCNGSSPVHSVARDAVGQMNFVKGGLGWVCTGTLLNDLDDETYVSYFLTAYHCISSQEVTNTLEVVWLWQTNSCGGSVPDYSMLPRNTGGTLLATNPTDGGNDMSFIRLAGELPGGVSLAGWTTDRPDNAYGIHHPAGSWKRVTFLSNVGFCPGCEFCGDGTDYDYYDMDRGILEGGSSGSGVFNSAGQLAGHLFGTCCLSLNCSGEDITCDTKDEFAAQYGEFETTYPIIRRWLEMGGTIHVDAAYSGLELGTPSQPFNTIEEAYNFAWDGARIMIQVGSYPETLTISKKITLLATGGTVTIGR